MYLIESSTHTQLQIIHAWRTYTDQVLQYLPKEMFHATAGRLRGGGRHSSPRRKLTLAQYGQEIDNGHAVLGRSRGETNTTVATVARGGGTLCRKWVWEMGVENGKSHLQLGYFSNGGNSSVVREVSRNSSGDGDGSKSNSNGEFHGAIIKGGG